MPDRYAIKVQENGKRLGSSVYRSSYQIVSPTVGIKTLTPNAVKSSALLTGFMKADLTVTNIHATVNIVMIDTKMYRQKM